VFIKGTVAYSSGWTEVIGQPGVWQHDWNPNLLMQGYDSNNGPRSTLPQRTEMMFANGKRLTPVELEKWNITFVDGYRWKYAYQGWAGFSGMKDYTFGVGEMGNTDADTTTNQDGMLYTGNTAVRSSGYELSRRSTTARVPKLVPLSATPTALPTRSSSSCLRA